MIRYVLGFLAVTNVYLYWKLRLAFSGGIWNLLYLVWALLWAAMPFASRSGFFGSGRAPEILFSLSFTWVAVVGIACGVFLLMDALSLATSLADWILGTASRRFFAHRRRALVALCLIAGVVIYSFYEAWDVRRVDLTLATDKLPEGVERLRLVHLTDIHIGGLYTPGRLAKVMDIVHAAEPDLVVMTGDVADGDMSRREREAELLSAHGAKYGAFAVMGNHEFYSGIEKAADFKRRCEFVVLHDSWVDVAGIVVAGLDDLARQGRDAAESLPEGMSFPEGRFVLLLKHRPQVIKGMEGKFDLQLSGHTHGGQIWPFGYVVQRANNHVQHLSYIGESAVYVSNGAGFWGPPLRFLTPPEVTVIDLVKK